MNPKLAQVDWYFDAEELGENIIVRWIPPSQVVVEFTDGTLIDNSHGSTAETMEQAQAHFLSRYNQAHRMATS